MRLLALEPYYGGSHQAFLDQWISLSRHQWQLLTLPAHHWKWRMRHAGIWLAGQARQTWQGGTRWDAILCSDMLDLAQFVALVGSPVAQLPRVVYFHENQLTYPSRFGGERDLHYAMTNFTSALVADQVWFNSDFHRRSFLDAAADWFGRMPDYQPLSELEAVRAKSHVEPPGIAVALPGSTLPTPPLHIAWAARWEHDKDPETFFQALRLLQAARIDFRLTICGESFRDVPPEFAAARRELARAIVHWGHLPDRDDYLRALAKAHVFVSTARHEFFGLSAMESIALGLFPVLPQRLSYPELLELPANEIAQQFFFDGTADGLAQRLIALARNPLTLADPQSRDHLRMTARRYDWSHRAPALDTALEHLI